MSFSAEMSYLSIRKDTLTYYRSNKVLLLSSDRAVRDNKVEGGKFDHPRGFVYFGNSASGQVIYFHSF